MTHSVDTSWPLSQSTLSAPNGLMNKVTMVIGMEVRQRAKQHELLLSKAALATTTAECPIWQQQKPTLSPVWHHSLGDQPGSRLVTLDHFHHGRERCCSYWNKYYSGYDLPSLYGKFVLKLSSMNLQHTLSTIMVMHTASRNSFHNKWSVAVSQCLWGSLALPCSPPSWSNCLDTYVLLILLMLA